MDLPQCYNNDSSNSPEDECFTEREFSSVYLVTYNQADVVKFPTCEVFGHATGESFSTGTAKVVQWVCCQESIKKAKTHIIWPSNWTETRRGWCPNAICSAHMVSPCTTLAVITVTIVLGRTLLSLIENSRRAQGTKIYICMLCCSQWRPFSSGLIWA